MRMERLILDKLEWQTDAITPLTFFQLFYEMFIDRDQRLAQPSMLNSFIAKLEVLMGQFEFTKYKVSVRYNHNKHHYSHLHSTSLLCIDSDTDRYTRLSYIPTDGGFALCRLS